MTDDPETPEPHVPVDRPAKARASAAALIVSASVWFAIVFFCLKWIF